MCVQYATMVWTQNERKIMNHVCMVVSSKRKKVKKNGSSMATKQNEK